MMRIELIPRSNRDQLALRIGRTAAESWGRRSVLNDTPVDRHHAGAIEQLHFRAVTDDGRALGPELLPGPAELAVADTPGASVELGRLASPENYRAAVGIEPDPIGALACRFPIDQGLARKDPQERLARGRRNPCRADRCIRPDVGKAAGIEQEPQQPADLPVRRAAVRVNPATNDDQVVARDDKGVLTADALGEKKTLGRLDRRRK